MKSPLYFGPLTLELMFKITIFSLLAPFAINDAITFNLASLALLNASWVFVLYVLVGTYEALDSKEILIFNKILSLIIFLPISYKLIPFII